jgi:hypothetical protein
MIQKRQDGDLGYTEEIDLQLTLVYQILFEGEKVKYPLTFTIEEALKRFSALKCPDPEKLVIFFKNFTNKYPKLLNFSSTTPGMAGDLITFRRVFPNPIRFVGKKRWAL